jgi:lipid A ethanolaminephosphotransferase
LTPFSKPLRPYLLIVLVALLMTVTANQSFFSAVLSIYPWADNLAFLVSLSLLLFALQVFVIALVSVVLPLRVVLALLLLIAASSSYFSDTYGTVVNDEMLRNVLETNPAESADLMSLGFVIRMLLLGVLPAFLVFRVPLDSAAWWRRKLNIALTGVAALGVMGLCVASASGQYASFIREHKPVRYYISPGYPIYSAIQFAAAQFGSGEKPPFEFLQANAQVASGFGHQELVVLVVGETVRADHLGLNGYSRDTTPLLSKMERLISFSQISACGTSTAVSVPCMFSYLGHDNLDVDRARNSENVLDVLSEAGIKVLWRDNNSDSKGVAKRIKSEDFRHPDNNPVCDEECRDIGMLSGLQEYIDSTPGDKLIVLHQMGNHGPAYYKRYPKDFEVYTPTCQSNELSECSDEEVINAYDNALRYTDYFLSEVIALLKRNTPRYETSMVYVSDHGESLGEKGIYLHGMPYTFAPESQIHVPVLVWASENSDVDYEESVVRRDEPNSHDAVFDALLGLFEVESTLPPKDKQALLIFEEH